ncbi:MAG: putative 4-mercaptohistidine N1-methyltransferase [Verrucomicrobiales bacterium]
MENPYESDRLVNEYLLFHYGADDEVLPWGFGPREALRFAARTVAETFAPPAAGRALDLGCAVGRSAFELSKTCDAVVGIDFSHAFIAAAQRLKDTGRHEYERHEEAARFAPAVAEVPAGARPERVAFEQGDAMDLRGDLGQFDAVHAANLLCRLPEPARFLARLPDLVRPGGRLVLTTPCTWLEEFTPRQNWPRGATLDFLQDHLAASFALDRTQEMPFLIREHARKFQWTVAQASVWTRR